MMSIVPIILASYFYFDNVWFHNSTHLLGLWAQVVIWQSSACIWWQWQQSKMPIHMFPLLWNALFLGFYNAISSSHTNISSLSSFLFGIHIQYNQYWSIRSTQQLSKLLPGHLISMVCLHLVEEPQIDAYDFGIRPQIHTWAVWTPAVR
jgi:hypothetical protein